MTISYKWLSEYLPLTIEPERLARILTSVGLEVENFEKFEEVKGGLKGLIIGEVLSTEKHPNADKLTLTKVSIGNGEPLQIVCGAPNVAAGQKVVVATVGTTIFPTKGETIIKIAKHRNGSLETVKLKALLHIQKFVEDDGSGMAGIGLPGNWKPVPDNEGSGNARLYIQTGSKMNDLPEEDEDTPF